ncbi:aspartate 4-decarboxylase [Turicibacter bilis]|uniref:Aminotransferase n=1 Tax=Turicibacter bilis TaxID=2735723 RepID=A0A9Q9FES8_9FIRM|nr:aspartate 4-decarboxylase [Turicibacter bilis]MBS3198521.1 aspartate 4-decarboxylase [Turicibacter bilis]MDD6761695.1 aspartate 4-decarboxylase [Turicibacter sp.]UUF08698.1 aspartate 4-decarboxylase [Turicibacter bilis]
MTTHEENRRKKIQDMIKKVESLSPFELKDELIKMAKKSEQKGIRMMLNAGRGNPNWTAATPRQAFFTFGQFAVEETQRTWSDKDLAGMPEKAGIYDRFLMYTKHNSNAPGVELLKAIIEYGIKEHDFDPDSWVFELTDAIIGDNYPVPDRMLIHTEKVVKDYVIKEMGGDPKTATHDLYAVEGGTAAMCYIFDSLIANRILSPGDKIALFVPIFTPYVEIANLPRYHFDIVKIYASEVNENGRHTWQYPKEQLDKLADTKIKLACVVNPSNPPSVAINEESMFYLKHIVESKNPDLMIVTDDVYGTFADKFQSLMCSMPYNTLGVYSYSKYFGVTGWRLGVIALAKDNVYNHLIEQLPEDAKDILRERYGALTTDPDHIPFIDRIVADSRQVALNHTAGLSTPQQVQMAFFSIFALLDKNDTYKNQTKEICRRRKQLLHTYLDELTLEENPYSTSYYDEIDLLVWAKLKYGEEFVEYLKEERNSLEFLFELADRYSIVLLNGSGFEGPSWSIRVSLANLKDEEYAEIGKAINELFAKYAEDWNAFKW